MTLNTFPPNLRDDLDAIPLRSSGTGLRFGRDRGRLAVGVLVLALSALSAAVVYGRVGDRRPVLAVANTVDPGEVIEARDLTVVRVATDPEVKTVAPTAKEMLVGRRAAARLLAGSLVTPGAVTDGPPVAPGMAVIGALVKPGQYPDGLRAGDVVEVAVTPAGAGDRPVTALITSVSGSAATGGVPVSLAVPGPNAPRLATAGAESRLLLMVPAR